MRKLDFGTIGAVAVACMLVNATAASAADAAVRGLIERIAPGHAADFILEEIPAPAGENVFEVDSRDGKIVLRGDGPLSQAVAFNWYLKHIAFVSVSWYLEDAVTVPEKFSLPQEKIRRTTRLKDRFFLNYCTFGYTMPFYHWDQWERLVDWMALQGINLPLAQNGNEYIWQKVWREYGLSDEEIRTFFTGPAHLPWNRMLNIDWWQGPLPQSYIDAQHDLQKKIVARERELGMSPVLCAFAGHVPPVLKQKHPEFHLQRIPPGWAGMPEHYACWFLSPTDPKFKEIQVKFLKEQQKEYGASHYYGTDPFNEIQPPSWEPAYLADTARAIYGGMAAVDPEAVWLQMAWTFHNDHEHWTAPRLSAMIRAVPQGRMLLIDYVCEKEEIYKTTDAFYGAPFLWDYLGNFGGNNQLVGPLNMINRRLTDAMNDPKLPNLAGVGATLEGLNNPVDYEMLFERPWHGKSMDVAAWVRDAARARAGGPDEKVEQAWELLRRKVLLDDSSSYWGRGVVYQLCDPALRGNQWLDPAIAYDNKDLFRAWELLLQAGPAARKTSAYRRDLLDVSRQALGNLGLELRAKMAAAYDKKDAAAFTQAAGQFMALGRDIDALLACKGEFMLGKWIADAKSWAADKSEEAYYEKNARTIVTVWSRPSILVDYAGRQWNGLMRDYYLPRWQMFIDATIDELKTGKPANLEDLKTKWRAFEWQYATTTGSDYPARPQGDAYEMSRAMFRKYAPVVLGRKAGD